MSIEARQYISTVIAHEPLLKKGGAQVVAGSTSARFAELKRLGTVVALDQKEKPGKIDFDIPPEYLYLFPTPTSQDELISSIQTGLKRQPDQIAYSHYPTAAEAVIEAMDGLELLPHGTMSHTWQDLTLLVGTGSVETILANHRSNALQKSDRPYSEDRRLRERRILRETNFIALQTEAERELLAQIYAYKDITPDQIREKTILVPLGVDKKFHLLGSLTETQREATRKVGRQQVLQILIDNKMEEEALKLAQLPEETHFFYSVSRLAKGKGNENAIQAFIEMKKTMYAIDPKQAEKIAMVFCGGPLQGNPVYDKMQEIIANSGDEATQQAMRDSIIFTGWMDGYYAAKMGHTFVGFSDNESFYLVLAEAMASENASVLTDYPTIRSVSGHDANLYGNATDLARPQMINPYNTSQAAEALLNLVINPAYRRANAARNQRIGSTYTVAKSVDILMKQLQQRNYLR